ncbi:15198_t:CDS:2 [Funneliformis geosporum]|uniref:11961_t:CDS:1 n=1 Tax=Funneliformis geosporum TaxID=1117311 RepID=A0A9W4WKE9_9GLOM|nr:11961_t:CDS:2 [Funneliformis geosporum]CAI2173399.1 15198_t:CDS:2 [Funneliformis geosporum]
MDEFSKEKKWDSIYELCENLKKSDRKPDLNIYNTILRSYIPFGSIRNSMKILEDMRLSDVKPNIVTYNYLLRTCAQASSSEQEPYLREQILEMITKDGLQPTKKTNECYIDSLLAGEEYERAFDWFDSSMIKSLEMYTAIIRKAIAINEPGLVLKYLKNLENDQLINVPDSLYNDILRFYAYEYYAEGVQYCWEKLRLRGKVDLDEGACIDMLYFAGKYGKTDLIVQVMEYLMDVRKVKFQKWHFFPLLQAYVKAKEIKKAMETLYIMRNSGLKVSLFDANEIFLHIRKNSESIDQAYYCLEELHKEGKDIDPTALNVIIAACSNVGGTPKRNIDMVRAFETYKAAEKLGVKPNTETFNILLLICCLAKQKDVADQLWQEMHDLHIVPIGLTYCRMIKTICTQDDYEEAFTYLEEMKSKNILPSQDVYDNIIKKCVLNGDARAKIALEEMEGFGYELSESLYYYLKDSGLVIKNPNRQQRNVQKKNEGFEASSTPNKTSDGMDEFVDTIASLEANKNEQGIN